MFVHPIGPLLIPALLSSTCVLSCLQLHGYDWISLTTTGSVPVTPALLTPTNDIDTIRSFADRIGYPVMIKAVDGGGGRGIRLVRRAEDLASLAQRAIEESPSRQVFAEKAAVNGFRHVEVQIVGDGTGKGGVRHLWERECSIQRRYQKVVELAPSTIQDRDLVGEVIGAAVRMAEKINYFSLGTFEFLVNPTTRTFFFLEVNPRLQVEHTITESLLSSTFLDLVQTQLLLSQGTPLTSIPGIPQHQLNPRTPPPLHSIQLRLTAENPAASFSLSPGRIASLRLPTSSGPGIRVDTHAPQTVTTDFDSLLAKLVVTAPTWPACVRRARRALADAEVVGVATNLGVLRAIAAHADFEGGRCDTAWFEREAEGLVREGEAIGGEIGGRDTVGLAAAGTGETAAEAGSGVGSATTMLFRKGDAWAVTLEPQGREEGKGSAGAAAAGAPTHHLELSRVLRNDFPSSLSAEILFSQTAAGEDGKASSSTPYVLHLAATTASSSAALSQHRRGSLDDPTHVCIPFAGKVVEILVEEGDEVREGDVVCVVQQMKMELEVRSSRAGRVAWAFEGDEGEEVAEGTLACILELEGKEKARL